MSVNAVIFDIGNVLLEWHPERFYDQAIGVDRRKALFSEVPLYDMNARIDLGADFQQTVSREADTYPKWGPEIRLWHDQWLEMASPVIDHSVRLLRALREKDVPVFALTNFGVGTFELACKAYPFLEEFDRRYVSGAMRLVKPDTRIYEAVEAECGLPAETLLFTDDRPENITAAQARGWQTHLFEGPEGWSEMLVAQGLLSAQEAK